MGGHAGDHVSAIPLTADTKPTVVATPNAGHGDREKAAGRQGYSVAYFARKHGITRQQAEELIARIGDDRDTLNAAAERLGKPVLVNAARD